MIPIAKPTAALLVNGMPRFVAVGNRDDAAGLPPTPPVVTVFTTVDKTP